MASQLIGDDFGIVLIASRKNLARLRESHSNPSDPRVSLLGGMNRRQLVGVGTDGGGVIQTVVQTTGREEAEKTTRAISQFGWTVFAQSQLEVDEEDEILVLPFSGYSKYLEQGGPIECADRKAWAFPAEKGLYDVYSGHLLEPEDVEAESLADRSVWFILVQAESPRELALDSLPGCQ